MAAVAGCAPAARAEAFFVQVARYAFFAGVVAPYRPVRPVIICRGVTDLAYGVSCVCAKAACTGEALETGLSDAPGRRTDLFPYQVQVAAVMRPVAVRAYRSLDACSVRVPGMLFPFVEAYL